MNNIKKLIFIIFITLAPLLNSIETTEQILQNNEVLMPPISRDEAMNWTSIPFLEEQVQKSMALLQDVTDTKGEEESVKKFIASLRGDYASLTILPSNGNSGDAVYKVIDSSKTAVLYVKIMKKDFAEFLPEILGIRLIEMLNLHHLKGVKIVGVAAYYNKEKNDRYVMIAQTPAHGTTLSKRFENSLALEKGSKERESAFKNLEKIMYRLGQGLQEFHYARPALKKALHPYPEKIYRRTAERAISKIQQSPRYGLKASKVREKFEESISKLTDKPFTWSFTHNDANFDNFLYDENNDTLSTIDLANTSLSVGRSYTPIGAAAEDVATIYDQITLRKISGLTKKEAKLLKNAFIDGYQSFGNKVPPQEQIDFFLYKIALKRVIKYYGETSNIFLEQTVITLKS